MIGGTGASVLSRSRARDQSQSLGHNDIPIIEDREWRISLQIPDRKERVTSEPFHLSITNMYTIACLLKLSRSAMSPWCPLSSCLWFHVSSHVLQKYRASQSFANDIFFVLPFAALDCHSLCSASKTQQHTRKHLGNTTIETPWIFATCWQLVIPEYLREIMPLWYHADDDERNRPDWF